MTSPNLMPVEGPLIPLAWTPDVSVDRDGLAAAWAWLAGRLASGSLVPLQERIYAEPEHLPTVLELRAEALSHAGLDPSTPVTVVANRPCLGGLCAGIHLTCWQTGGQGRATTIEHGRQLDLGRSRALFLADLRPEQGADEPLRSMFDRATAALASRGMTFRDVGRTWLYVRDLLPTYATLNGVRDAVFEEQGLGTPGAWSDPPASTGIQAFHPTDAPCFMDLVAIKDLSGERRVESIEPELQCEAWSYGSAFARGASIQLGSSALTTISGTASIGGDGLSLHHGDPEAQLRETLRNVESLLAHRCLPPRTLGLWTLYFKDVATWRVWRRLVEAGELDDVQGAAVFGDVCRDELLFELEVTTVG